MQLKISMLQLELKVKYWWWCTDESLLYCQCSCSFQFNTIKSLIVNYLTWVMCSPHFSPAPRGAQPGPCGEPSGPGGGGWRLLRVSHQGPSLSIQSDLETQCKTIFFFPKTQYTIYLSREMPITTRHPGYSKIQFVNGLFRCQGLEIYPRPGDGKIISNQSLVIQKVAKADAGNYTCQAFNVEGQMESQPQLLDIMCKCQADPVSIKMQILKGEFPNSLHFVTNCQTILRLTNHKFCKMQISTGNSIMILYFDFSVH